MTKDLPSPELLRKLICPDFKAGKLYWRERTPDMFEPQKWTPEHRCKAWNSRYAGTEAFTAITCRGYKKGSFFNKKLFAHRVLWAMHKGKWPASNIDHINGDPSDNRIENLREATQSQNLANSRMSTTNTSGYKGVSWHEPTQKWMARIKKNGEKYYLGLFSCPEDAYQAFCTATKEMNGQYANFGNSLASELADR